MLTKLELLKGYKLNAVDGEIGEAASFLFDDQHWTVRYLAANTGKWLSNKQILISPYAISKIIHHGRILSVDLTRKQIQNGPNLGTGKPVTSQFEEDYHSFYGWPAYWGGNSAWGISGSIERDRTRLGEVARGAKAWDRHLRTNSEVKGYRVQALEGEIGIIEDCVIDEETWSIRYFVVDAKSCWPGRKVLISTKWIERMSWSEGKVSINLSRDAVKQSPEFSDGSILDRNYETALYRHYNRKSYWIDELAAV